MRSPMDYAADFPLDDLDRPQATPLTPEQIEESVANLEEYHTSMIDPDYIHLVMVGMTELLREQGEALAAARKSAA